MTEKITKRKTYNHWVCWILDIGFGSDRKHNFESYLEFNYIHFGI